MACLRRIWGWLYPQPPALPRTLTSTGFPLLDPNAHVEEELMPHYELANYFPVRLGDVLREQYQVLKKLGYGANATGWFCHNLTIRENRYVAIKIYLYTARENREIKFLKHLSSIRSIHPGLKLVRAMVDHFELEGSKGLLHDLQRLLGLDRLHGALLKEALIHLLTVLNYLHSEAHVIIPSKNIMIACKDPSFFEKLVEDEEQTPSPRKVVGDNIAYRSHSLPHSSSRFQGAWGIPLLSDFGETRVGDNHTGLIQPNLYREPDVVLKMDGARR
ncbi:hypothetical protein M501DRAFT_1006240 [Patellaria atrata CBS 101060]|uniref:non-specific serine/threonine protein kinase n=1 Tax=Patellaria atrata CBS 101060 TaxID=1346257 RepID=A0A9P4SK78_9PEZI|nr:hypothetical protein M501DRAFT_1006240 [Patellaria atrata CBS 101060]